MSTPYVATFIADNLTVQLIGKSRADDSHEPRMVELFVEDGIVGILEFLPHYGPALAKGKDDLAIWGGTSFYNYNLQSKTLTFFAQEYEVLAAYSFPGRWLLVCEIALVLLSMPDGKELSRYDHNEIIISSYLQENILIVNDLETFQAGFGIRDGDILHQVSPWQLVR